MVTDPEAQPREDVVNEAIVLLLLLWAALLLPGALRSRNSSPHTTVGGFERAMDVLRAKPGQGRELLVPGDAGRIVTRGLGREPDAPASGAGEDPIVARRRTWFVRLLGATGVALLLALAVGGWLWMPFTALLLCSAGYTALLRHLKLQRDQARRVVRDLDLRHERGGSEGPNAGDEPPALIDHAPAEDGGLALQSVRLRRWDG